LVAHEAVEHPLLGNDREVAMRAAVEGTGTAIVRPRTLELDVLADDGDEVRGFADLLDDVVGDHDGRMGGWADGPSTRSSSPAAITRRTAPTSTTTRPSDRTSATTP